MGIFVKKKKSTGIEQIFFIQLILILNKVYTYSIKMFYEFSNLSFNFFILCFVKIFDRNDINLQNHKIWMIINI